MSDPSPITYSPPELESARARAQEVAEYLRSLPETAAHPCAVKIGRTTYVGAFFAQLRTNDPGTGAYADGRRIYVHTGYYLLGTLPPSTRRPIAYTLGRKGGHGGRYYIGSWYQDVPSNDYHPFGPMFMLSEDDHGVTDDMRRTLPIVIETL